MNIQVADTEIVVGSKVLVSTSNMKLRGSVYQSATVLSWDRWIDGTKQGLYRFRVEYDQRWLGIFRVRDTVSGADVRGILDTGKLASEPIAETPAPEVTA